MSKYQIEFTRSARKEFSCLPAKIQNRIVEILKVLANNPYTEILNIKKLKGEDSLYRVRMGDYRVVYSIVDQTLKIVIIKVGHRKDVYR